MAIGLLAETFFVLIINSLQVTLKAETDFSQSGQICNLAMLDKMHYRTLTSGAPRLSFGDTKNISLSPYACYKRGI